MIRLVLLLALVQGALGGVLAYVGLHLESAPDNDAIGVFAADAYGHLTMLQRVPCDENPTGLAFNYDHSHFAAVSQDERTVTSYVVSSDTGYLRTVSVKGGGHWPCFVRFDDSEAYLGVGDCAAGTATLYPIDRNGAYLNDSVSEVPDHPGGEVRDVVFTEDPSVSDGNNHMLVVNRATGRIWQYILDLATGKLEPAADPFYDLAGPGTCKLILHPTIQSMAITINDLDSTVDVLSFYREAGIIVGQTQAFKTGGRPVQIKLSDNGMVLLVLSYEDSAIMSYFIDIIDGVIAEAAVSTVPTGGQNPIDFAIYKNLIVVINEVASSGEGGSSTAFVFDDESGVITPLQRSETVMATPPVSIALSSR